MSLPFLGSGSHSQPFADLPDFELSLKAPQQWHIAKWNLIYQPRYTSDYQSNIRPFTSFHHKCFPHQPHRLEFTHEIGMWPLRHHSPTRTDSCALQIPHPPHSRSVTCSKQRERNQRQQTVPAQETTRSVSGSELGTQKGKIKAPARGNGRLGVKEKWLR